MDRRHEGWARSCWAAAACLVVACGGRSGELYYDEVSTGNGGSGGSDNFGGAGGSDNTGGSSNFGGTAGAGGTGTTSGPLECLGCLAQSCPFLVKCAQDVTCYQRVLCTVRDCFDDAPSLECLVRCHDGDVAAALEFAGALACAAQTCGDRCNFEQ